MPPRTRSASRRAANTSASPKAPVARKRLRKGKRPIVVTQPARCILLQMPPEIRNRIYHFCKENAFDEFRGPPRALRRNGEIIDLPQHMKARTFFHLTQTCKQIRTEYRPLWLCDSSVRVDFRDLDDFIATFHTSTVPVIAELPSAPKLLLISWDHEQNGMNDNDLLIDIGPILQLRAHAPSSTIKFVCRRLVESDLPHANCYCGRCIRCGSTDSIYDDDGDSDSLYCDHESVIEEISDMLVDTYEYLEPLNTFLANNDERWLKQIRHVYLDLMSVQCTMGQCSKVPTIYIRFAEGVHPAELHVEHMYSGACTWLRQVGIMDLEDRTGLDFIVGIAVGKYTRPSTKSPTVTPTYIQTYICGRTYKASVVHSQHDD